MPQNPTKHFNERLSQVQSTFKVEPKLKWGSFAIMQNVFSAIQEIPENIKKEDTCSGKCSFLQFTCLGCRHAKDELWERLKIHIASRTPPSSSSCSNSWVCILIWFKSEFHLPFSVMLLYPQEHTSVNPALQHDILNRFNFWFLPYHFHLEDM